jgi:hypothetical protein
VAYPNIFGSKRVSLSKAFGIDEINN